MKKHIRTILFVLVSFIIGFTILYFLYDKFNTDYIAQSKQDNIPLSKYPLRDKLFSDFRSVNIFWILIMLAAYTLSNVSRALRWKMLFKSIGYNPKISNTFFSVMVTYFVNLFIPRMGEVARAAAMKKFEDIPVEKAMGTIVVDRVMDVICLFAVIGIAFLLEYDTLWSWLRENALNNPGNLAKFQYLVIGGGIAFVLAMASFFFFRKKIQTFSIYKKVQKILLGFWEGLLSVKNLDRPGLFIFHSIFIWSMYFLMNYFGFLAFAPTENLTLTVGLMVFVFGAFGIVIPSPGGMGTYHWLVVAALGLYGINKYDAFSFANIAFFSIQFFCNILMGIASVILLFLLNKNYKPKHPASASTESTESIM